MRALESFVRGVDWLNERVGRATAWLTLATVLICAAVVLLRYAFNVGYIWLQELYVWTYATVFMVGAGYTLLHGGHVRVDIFYAPASPRRKAWIDLLGTVGFLLPWLALIGVSSWSYVTTSWALSEASPQSDGMPAIYLLKSVLLIFVVLLGLQALAIVVRSVLVLSGRESPPAPNGGR